MYGDYQREFGQQALQYLFSQPVRPTAVFAASDYLVLGLLDGCAPADSRRRRRCR
jgi:LacI family transcriptional regulator